MIKKYIVKVIKDSDTTSVYIIYTSPSISNTSSVKTRSAGSFRG